MGRQRVGQNFDLLKLLMDVLFSTGQFVSTATAALCLNPCQLKVR